MARHEGLIRRRFRRLGESGAVVERFGRHERYPGVGAHSEARPGRARQARADDDLGEGRRVRRRGRAWIMLTAVTTTGAASTREGVRVHVEATIDLGDGDPAEIAVRMALARRSDVRIRKESFTIGGEDLEIAVDADGSSVAFVRTTGAPSQIRYGADAILRGVPARATSSLRERLEFTTQSRYCPSDLTGGLAGSLFGPLHGAEAIEAVTAWVREHITYLFFSSGASTTAIDSLTAAAGVCRDFAHLTICLLRSLGVPARYVAVYSPDLELQDFHAVVEAHDGEMWRLVDPTGLSDPALALRIATGRDGADTPFFSVLSGFAPVMLVQVDVRSW